MKERIGQGRTADIFRHPDNGSRVIKLFQPHVPEDDVRREFQIAALAHSLGVPTPEPFEIIRANGRWGIVFERAAGEPLLKQMLGKPLSFKRHARKLAALHHALHVRKMDGQLATDRRLPRQKDVLKRHILSASALSEDEKQIAIARLEQLPDGDRLCHGDFHPDNVMTGEKDWMLDWVNGMRGHPAGDVARTVMLLSVGAMPPGTPRYVNMLANVYRKKIRDQYVKDYLKRSGMKAADIDRWLLPVAAARLNEQVPEEERRQLLNFVRRQSRPVLPVRQ
jgi:uncharacterized protein (TIGR02172 family)